MKKRKTTIKHSTPKGGRKRLPSQQRRKMFWIYLNEEEEEVLLARKGESQKKFSEYMRDALLADAKKPAHHNPVNYFNTLSELAHEVNKLGVNVNQISRYVNQLILMNRVEPHIIELFFTKLEAYAKMQSAIEDKLKELIFI